MSVKIPEHLSDESKTIWRQIAQKYEIENDWRPLLQTALEARDRMQQARERIATEGLTIKDRFGEMRPHPCLPAEEKSRLAFLKAWRAMQLDIEPPADTGKGV